MYIFYLLKDIEMFAVDLVRIWHVRRRKKEYNFIFTRSVILHVYDFQDFRFSFFFLLLLPIGIGLHFLLVYQQLYFNRVYRWLREKMHCPLPEMNFCVPHWLENADRKRNRDVVTAPVVDTAVKRSTRSATDITVSYRVLTVLFDNGSGREPRISGFRVFPLPGFMVESHGANVLRVATVKTRFCVLPAIIQTKRISRARLTRSEQWYIWMC